MYKTIEVEYPVKHYNIYGVKISINTCLQYFIGNSDILLYICIIKNKKVQNYKHRVKEMAYNAGMKSNCLQRSEERRVGKECRL